jgi:cytochrome c nitrite reductase small subunit
MLPPGWRAGRAIYALPILIGALVGVGTFTFGYGKGASYLSSDPGACANCHVMQEYYDGWSRSSHHAVAGCVDCHLPHDFAGKWFAKADNGFNHSLVFTLGTPDVIQIKPRNRRITQRNCVACHRDAVDPILPDSPHGEAIDCARCHADVGHAAKRR